MSTADELRRAEHGDPWAVLLVGILRTVPSNTTSSRPPELSQLTLTAEPEPDAVNRAAADD
jgi:hypothetical protein